MPKLKIAFIIDTIATSTAGTEKQLLALLSRIDKSHFEPHLICLRNSEWLNNNTLSVKTHVLGVGSLLGLSAIRGLLHFGELNRDIHFDIVQTFFIDGNIFGTIIATISGCDTIVSSRRNIGYWHKRFHVFVLRFLKRWTSHYLCNSKAAGDMTMSIEQVPPSKIHIIYNGLDLEPFSAVTDNDRDAQRKNWSASDNEIVIGAVANLRPVKNIQLLIQAASEVVKEFPNLRFVVIGEGHLREELQGSIDTLGLTDRFTLAGQHLNIPLALSAFDIAVMPSLSESFSNSLIEYMAAKLPIVSSDSGGNSEAIEHGKTGLLFSLEDKSGLSDGIRELISDKVKAGKLGENACHEAIKKYDITVMTENHQRYYKEILER